MTQLEFKRVKALRGLGGEYNDIGDVIEYLRKHENQQVDFLSIAVLVDDVKKESQLPGIMIKDGHLGVPPEDFIKKEREPLTPELLASVEFGGGGNVTLPAAILGINTGVMGYIGNDTEGGYFLCGMVQNHINTFGVIVKPEYRTDVALNALLESGERAPIPFCEDAGKYFDINREVKEKLVILNPKIVQISYSGLFEKGADLEGGKRLADGIRWIKENLESLVMVDTHTYGAEPKRYDCLKPSLEVADMFVCSDKEVELIVPQYGIKSNQGIEKQKQAFLSYLKENYCKGNKARLYAVTAPEKTTVLYYKPSGNTEQIEVENWFFTTKDEGSIHDATGAGDSWRAGLNAYISKHMEEFDSGDLNLGEAVQFANLTARLYISGKGIEAFKHCNGTYDRLLRVVSGDKPKTDLKELQGVYEVILTAGMKSK